MIRRLFCRASNNDQNNITEIAAVKTSSLRMNQTASGFSAVTTRGSKMLSDYEGKWLVLFSHPAYFTLVCTTEFMAFANRQDEFSKLNTEF